jgi:flagellar biosynthesis protein FlhG
VSTAAVQRPASDQASRLRRLINEPALRPPPIAAIASGKGGVGKSLLAVSIAALLAPTRRVVLLDADFGAANADIMLGVAPLRRLDEPFRTAFAHGRRPSDIAIEVGHAPGQFRLVPGIVGRGAAPDSDQRRRLMASLGEFARDTDLLIIDTAAGVGDEVLDMLAGADCPIVVTTPEPTALADAYALLKSLLRRHGPGPLVRTVMVINMAPDRAAAERVYRRMAAVADRFLGVRPLLAGWVPSDRRLAQGVRAQRPSAATGRRTRSVHSLIAIATWIDAAARNAHELRGVLPELGQR